MQRGRALMPLVRLALSYTPRGGTESVLSIIINHAIIIHYVPPDTCRVSPHFESQFPATDESVPLDVSTICRDRWRNSAVRYKDSLFQRKEMEMEERKGIKKGRISCSTLCLFRFILHTYHLCWIGEFNVYPHCPTRDIHGL